MNALFSIVLDTENKHIEERINETYSKTQRYKISPTNYIISTDQITEEIANVIGLKGEDQVDDASGVIFRLSGAYAGYTHKTLWEWLDQVQVRG